MIGGHALAPARSTVSRTNSLIAGTPSAGTNIRSALMFSAPKPFDATRDPHVEPGHDIDVHHRRAYRRPTVFSMRVGSPVTDQRR